MSTTFPKKNRLRLAFICTAIVAQIVAPKIPAFDTSHLIQPRYHGNYDSSSQAEHGSQFFSSPSQTYIASNSPSVDSNSGRHKDQSLDTPQLIDSAGLRWDALHYHSVALHGSYVFEHQYAFSPGVPIVLRLIHMGKQYLLRIFDHVQMDSLLGSYGLTALLVAIKAILIGLLACEPCLALYSLTMSITRSRDYAYLTLISFILMGAPPVILRNAYAEPFFAYFSFRGMNSCHHQAYLAASLYFASAALFRSNGIILVGFILYNLLVRPILEVVISSLGDTSGPVLRHTINSGLGAIKRTRVQTLIYATLLSAIVVSPFIAHQYLAYMTFCVGSESHLDTTIYPRPWCSSRIPSVYSFVQSYYWDVGLWRYWTLAQIPNFLLAAPMLTLLGGSSIMFLWSIWHRIRSIPQKSRDSDRTFSTSILSNPPTALTLLPYAIHGLALSLLLFTAAHVQIALRVLPTATPWASWAGAALVVTGVEDQGCAKDADKVTSSSPALANSKSAAKRSRSRRTFISHLWIGWSVIWAFVSSVLWLAFLPPA